MPHCLELVDKFPPKFSDQMNDCVLVSLNDIPAVESLLDQNQHNNTKTLNEVRDLQDSQMVVHAPMQLSDIEIS
jgi:hypothetical protein